jgi:CheY-like chemotaxis protein
MLTAMESFKLNERAFAAGAEVCLTKPFVADRLINMVNIAL